MSSDWVTDDGELTPKGEAAWLASQLGIMSLDEMKAQGPVKPEDHWIIPGVLSTSNTLVYGQSKVGKSFLVSQVVASAVDGRKFLDRDPLSSGYTALVITTDAGGRLEYQERLESLGIDSSGVHLMQVHEGMDPATWQDLYSFAELEGIGLVVLDHATGAVEGEINQREGWRELYACLNGFGEGVARVLVGHATDSKFEGSPIHRPSGNSAATQLARARVYLYAPGGLENPGRQVQLLSNNAPSETLHCLRGSDGYLVIDSEVTVKEYQRSEPKKDALKLIKELALKAPAGMNQDQVHEWIANQGEVRTSAGDLMAASTIGQRLKGLKKKKVVIWNRNQKRYCIPE